LSYISHIFHSRGGSEQRSSTPAAVIGGVTVVEMAAG
jgi:hypothetical protein